MNKTIGSIIKRSIVTYIVLIEFIARIRWKVRAKYVKNTFKVQLKIWSTVDAASLVCRLV